MEILGQFSAEINRNETNGMGRSCAISNAAEPSRFCRTGSRRARKHGWLASRKYP
jgi:hypothetical protein